MLPTLRVDIELDITDGLSVQGIFKLPSNFKLFLSLSANKAELASFLSEALVEIAPELQPSQKLVVAGGFNDVMKVWTSTDRVNHSLSSNHEEADTRLILHAKDAALEGYQRCVIQCSGKVCLPTVSERNRNYRDQSSSKGNVPCQQEITGHATPNEECT